MAAGGDMGASVAPQLMGIIVDTVASKAGQMSLAGALTPEQLGMKTGMLVAAIFPAMGVIWLFIIKKYFGIGKKQ
jgi:hypothetical protein